MYLFRHIFNPSNTVSKIDPYLISPRLSFLVIVFNKIMKTFCLFNGPTCHLSGDCSDYPKLESPQFFSVLQTENYARDYQGMII